MLEVIRGMQAGEMEEEGGLEGTAEAEVGVEEMEEGEAAAEEGEEEMVVVEVEEEGRKARCWVDDTMICNL